MKEELAIFDPRGKEKNYKEEYPELTEYDDLAKLSNSQLVWCWYVGNKTSPYNRSYLKWDDKCKKATETVFGSRYKWQQAGKETEYSNLYKGILRADMSVAVERMGRFDFTSRKEALSMLMEEFNQLQELSSLKPESFRGDGEGAAINYKDFIEVKKKIRLELVELLPILERGFGVKKQGKLVDEDEIDGQDYQNRFHKEEQGG